MSKKKTTKPQTNPKVALAQHRNDFFKQMSAFSKTATGVDIVPLIPKNSQDWLFQHRLRPIQIEAEPGHVLHELLIPFVKKLVNSWCHKTLIDLPGAHQKVTLYDLASMGLFLYIYHESLSSMPFKQAPEIQHILAPSFSKLKPIWDLITEKLDNLILPLIRVHLNDFSDGYHSLSIKTERKMGAHKFEAISVRIKHYPPTKEAFTCQQHTRPAFRIGWTFRDDQFEWMSLTPQKLGLQSPFGQLPIPIYIQNHALDRMAQRLDCIDQPFRHEGIIASLDKCKAIPDGPNHFLIEYRLLTTKVGYLSAQLIQGKLLIRTFLFLTCKDTPEGQRLETQLGLSKIDTTYLQMDKLSTFLTDQIKLNTELRQLFIKADCRQLIELNDELSFIAFPKKEHSPITYLCQYLSPSPNAMPEFVEETIES